MFEVSKILLWLAQQTITLKERQTKNVWRVDFQDIKKRSMR